MMYGLPCPVCNKLMLPLELMNEPASQAIKLFDGNGEKMTPINQIIFKKIKKAVPQTPQISIKEILTGMFPEAERKLILEQREILDELNFLSRDLPNKTGKELRRLINKTFEKLFKIEDNPKKRFKRKNAIADFDKFSETLKDSNLKKKVTNIIRKLPTSETSPNAFIVKYSTRSPEEIGMKLYRNDFGTLEHIIPESQGGRIVIWECAEDNAARGNVPVLEQLRQNPQMYSNLQDHIDRLIEIHDTEFTGAKKNMLKEYIFTLKNEYAIASNEVINLNIKALGNIPPQMIERERIRISDLGKTNYLRNLYKMLHD